jgi:NADPH-dependent curcumin reductase
MSEPAVKQIVLASRPKGLPTRENFRVEDVPMPELPQGGLLLRVLYLSLDPYMRGRMDDRKSYAQPVRVGEVMTGESVCEVIASDQPGYDVRDIVLARTGWRTHAASAGTTLRKLDPAAAPITTGLGVLGMPGFTAYAGLNLIGKPKPGETVVVAAASGPVGSLVGQLAKLAGARAVGIAGRSSGSRLCRKAARCLSEGHRCLFRKCRRRGLASRAAFAQYVCPRPGVRADRPIQRRGSRCRAKSPSRDHA